MTMPIASSDAGLLGADLKAAYQALIEERGFLPSVMAARILGVKEATLIHVLIGEDISQLSPDFAGLLNGARDLGKIMALVNNKHMVAMPIGEFSELDIVDNRGHARGGMIDLSFDLSRWGSVFSIVQEAHGAVRRNISFFDDCGDAVLQIIVWSKGGDAAYDTLVEQYRTEPPDALDLNPSEDAGWRTVEDGNLSHRVDEDVPSRTEAFLRQVVEREILIDVHIPTRACAQHYAGPLRAVERREDLPGYWVDLKYPHFNSHFELGGLASYAVGGNEGSQSKSLTLIDESNSIVCTFALAKEAQPAVRDNWIKTLDEQLHV